MKNWFWGFAHNFIAHGLLYGFVGERNWTNRFHDWTADRWNAVAE